MRFRLRHKLVSIALLGAIPFIAYAVSHYLIIVDDNKKAALERNLIKAEEASKELVDFIDSSQNALYALALHPAIVNHDTPKCDALFSQLLPLYPVHLNILAADMQGKSFASAVNPDKAHKIVYSDQDWFIKGTKGISVVTDLHTSLLVTEPSFMITMPVFSESGEQSAVLGFPVGLSRLRELFIEKELVSDHTNTSLVDRKGVILFNTADEQLTGKPYIRPEIFKKIFNVNEGTLTDFDPQGVKRFYSHATVETTGWKVLVETSANEVYAEANRGAVRHLVFFMLICLSGGIAALFLSRQLVGKVEHIISGLNEVAAGNFAFRLNIGGNDELAQASSAFNRMTAERAKAEEQIRDFTATLEKRVELRTLELTRAKDELEAFSYSVSHDLQAPVRHIIAYSEILLTDHGDELPEDVSTSLLKINKAGITMRELITHLLELSRLNRQELNLTETDLGGICRKICQELAADDPSRKVDVVIAEALVARCDPNLVEIVLRNLIGNSWKFTRRKASPLIEIGTTIHRDVRCFFVRDNGDGFDMAYAERLFTPFQRFHSADEFEGSGVGLATVMRIIQRHEGAIWAESSPNQGTVFYFTLGPADDTEVVHEKA